MKKRFCVSFYAAGEQLNEYETIFGEKSKNRDTETAYQKSGLFKQNQDSWNICS